MVSVLYVLRPGPRSTPSSNTVKRPVRPTGVGAGSSHGAGGGVPLGSGSSRSSGASKMPPAPSPPRPTAPSVSMAAVAYQAGMRCMNRVTASRSSGDPGRPLVPLGCLPGGMGLVDGDGAPGQEGEVEDHDRPQDAGVEQVAHRVAAPPGGGDHDPAQDGGGQPEEQRQPELAVVGLTQPGQHEREERSQRRAGIRPAATAWFTAPPCPSPGGGSVHLAARQYTERPPVTPERRPGVMAVLPAARDGFAGRG